MLMNPQMHPHFEAINKEKILMEARDALYIGGGGGRKSNFA
jgi:hypothetical protein